MVVYSCTDRESFEQARKFAERVLMRRKDPAEKKIAVVIVENKIDLQDERQVSVQEGKELANSLKVEFVQTSAKNRKNIDELFVSLYNKACGGKFEMVDFFDANRMEEWREEHFKHFPQDFRERVNTFLLVLKRLEGKKRKEKKESKFPKPVVKIVLKQLFEEERETWN